MKKSIKKNEQQSINQKPIQKKIFNGNSTLSQLQKKADNSPMVQKQLELQKMADESPVVQRQLKWQQMADEYLAKKHGYQPKLKVSDPNDKYEKEADEAAEKVMKKEDVNGTLSNSKSTIDRMEDDEELNEEPEEKEDEVQTKTLDIQAKGTENGKINEETSSQINNISGGQSLSKKELDFFEPKFGADFSNVKIHNDTNANHMASSINAKAFTKGNNIVFGKGQYQPGTESGKKLMAHELTHTIQQGKGIRRKATKLETDTSNLIFEWVKAQTQLLRISKEWSIRNITKILTYTEGKFNSNWISDYLKTMKITLIGNSLSFATQKVGGNLIKKLFTKGSSAIAGAGVGSFGGPVGTAIGFVVGLLVETTASFFLDKTAIENFVKGQISQHKKEEKIRDFFDEKYKGYNNLFEQAKKDNTQVLRNFSRTKLIKFKKDRELEIKAAQKLIKFFKPKDYNISLAINIIHDWVFNNAEDYNTA